MPDPFEIPAAAVREWRSGHLLPAISSILIHYVWDLGEGTAADFLVDLLAIWCRLGVAVLFVTHDIADSL